MQKRRCDVQDLRRDELKEDREQLRATEEILKERKSGRPIKTEVNRELER